MMFLQKVNFSSINRRAVEKLKTMLNIPKGPKTAYILFSTEALQSARAQNPTAKVTDLAKECGQKWRSMDAAAKAVYQRRAAQEKESASSAFSSFQSSLTDQQSRLLNLLSKVKRISSGRANRRILNQEERDLFDSLPQQPPRSAYMLFMQQKLKTSPSQGSSLAECQNRIKRISEEWKNLDAAEKERLAAQLKEMRLSFEQALRKPIH